MATNTAQKNVVCQYDFQVDADCTQWRKEAVNWLGFWLVAARVVLLRTNLGQHESENDAGKLMLEPIWLGGSIFNGMRGWC